MRMHVRTVLLTLCFAAVIGSAPAVAQQAALVPSQPTLAPLVEKVAPAVVNISVLSRSPVQDNPLLRDPFFRRFFELPDPDKIPPQMSAGSGVIVDVGKGYVITNHHVVDKATKSSLRCATADSSRQSSSAAIPQPTLRWCKSKLIG